jgi:recombination associated protein RdgC
VIFKNARFFTFDHQALKKIGLDDRLAARGLAALTAFEKERSGFVAASSDGALVFEAQPYLMVAMATDRKVLPASVVRQEMESKVQALEETRGRALSRKMKADMREDIEAELLARAFSVRHLYRIWMDRETGIGFVDQSSPKVQETFMTLWRDVVPEVAVTPVQTAVSPITAMTQWIAAGEAPRGFSIDQDAELRSAAAGQATVRYVRHPLEASEIRQHVVDGKQCTRLALTWADRVSFVLSEDFSLKRLQWAETSESEGSSDQSDEERFEADFALASGDMAQLVHDLIEALGGIDA